MKKTTQTPRKPVIMVSSTVDGIEDLLEQVFSILNENYTVWMSYKGTIRVNSGKSNFDNCLDAVDECDLFLGILTTSYGSGKDADGLSITHKELRAAIKRDIPRWFLSHRDLEFAFDLVRNLGFRIPDDVMKLNRRMKSLSRRGRNPVIDDYNALVMYSEVIQAKKDLIDRRGNWAQPFFTDRDGQIFVTAQFLRHSQALEEVKNGPLSALKQISAKGGTKP